MAIVSNKLYGMIINGKGGGVGNPVLELENLAGCTQFKMGTVAPEGAVSAETGSVYIDNTNGKWYIKESGTGNTGWTRLLMSPDSAFTEGSVLFVGADGNVTEDNTGLYFDPANNCLSIGTNTGEVPLTVSTETALTEIEIKNNSAAATNKWGVIGMYANTDTQSRKVANFRSNWNNITDATRVPSITIEGIDGVAGFTRLVELDGQNAILGQPSDTDYGVKSYDNGDLELRSGPDDRIFFTRHGTEVVSVESDSRVEFHGAAAPAVSTAGNAAMYFDSTENVLKVSENGGDYVNVVSNIIETQVFS